MQTILNDIELDIQELKCLMQAVTADPNPALRNVAKRNIRQMKARLDALQQLLEEVPEATPSTTTAPVHTPKPAIPEQTIPEKSTPTVEAAPEKRPEATPTKPDTPILAERIKPADSLRRSISLNDSFRFTRELFNGDAARMNEVVKQLGEASSLEEAIALFRSEVPQEEETEATTDFVELLKKYFS